jgi:hypothetical protein
MSGPTQTLVINGYLVEGAFLRLWLSQGDKALQIFGAPISRRFKTRVGEGTIIEVQYFRRVRMEQHGELVLLGNLGQEVFDRLRAEGGG